MPKVDAIAHIRSCEGKERLNSSYGHEKSNVYLYAQLKAGNLYKQGNLKYMYFHARI